MAVLIEAIKEVLFESSLSRMTEYALNRNMAIITAHRAEYSQSENNERNKNLERDIRERGYGFVKGTGRYKESAGTPDERWVNENVFILGGHKHEDDGKLLSDVKELGKKYNQDSILHKPHDSPQATVHYLKDFGDTRDGDAFLVGQFSADKIPEYHTTILKGSHKRRPFAFGGDGPRYSLETQKTFSNRLGTL